MDGAVLPKLPMEYVRAGGINPTPHMILGSNSYDSANLFYPSDYSIAPAQNMEAHINATTIPSEAAPAILEAYSPSKYYNDNLVRVFAQYEGDNVFHCPGRQLAALAANLLDVYWYSWNHKTQADPIYATTGLKEAANITVDDWASHAADLSFVLGLFVNPFTGMPLKPSAETVSLSQEIMTRWTSFAKTGNPNTRAYTGWDTVPKGGQAMSETTTMDAFVFAKEGGPCKAFRTKLPSVAPLTCGAKGRKTGKPPRRALERERRNQKRRSLESTENRMTRVQQVSIRFGWDCAVSLHTIPLHNKCRIDVELLNRYSRALSFIYTIAEVELWKRRSC